MGPFSVFSHTQQIVWRVESRLQFSTTLPLTYVRESGIACGKGRIFLHDPQGTSHISQSVQERVASLELLQYTTNRDKAPCLNLRGHISYILSQHSSSNPGPTVKHRRAVLKYQRAAKNTFVALLQGCPNMEDILLCLIACTNTRAVRGK